MKTDGYYELLDNGKYSGIVKIQDNKAFIFGWDCELLILPGEGKGDTFIGENCIGKLLFKNHPSEWFYEGTNYGKADYVWNYDPHARFILTKTDSTQSPEQ